MAVGTATAGFSHRRERAAMAIVTSDIEVSAMQQKIGLSVVIE